MNKILIFCIGMCLPAMCLSQNWCDQGALWYYGYANVGGAGYVTIKYKNDTTIGGQTCQLLQKKLHYTDGSSGGTTVQVIGNAYTYFQDDVVFTWDNLENDFDTLYYFGAKPGDIWNVSLSPQSQSNITITAEALGRGNRNIDGQLYRWINVQYQFVGNSAGTVYYSDTVYTKFGHTGTYMFPADWYYSLTDGNEGGAFRCYSDDITPLFNHNPLISCDYTTAIEEHSLSDYSVFPNPFKDILRIEFRVNRSSAYDLKIISLKGDVVFQKGIQWTSTESYPLHLGFLKPGMYAVLIYNGQSTEMIRIIKN
ncbi:MAG: T9SS type A sorting domain-containing protein [Bacteroidales bacterium]|nr:T9SS type A sorting domain-containing protein [Bacteroidales bacterium]